MEKESSVSIDFKIDPVYIPSTTIQKLEQFAHSSGGISDVWKCSMTIASGSRPVAIKSIRTSHMDDEASIRKISRKIRREAYVWIRLSHDNILPLEGITDGFGKLPALVSLWMENGTLSRYLKQEFSKLSEHRKHELVQQVAAGLAYLHEMDVVHGNLTGTNVLVDDSGNLRVADFGLSMIVGESDNLTFGSVQTGNTRWMAPESLSFAMSESLPKPTRAGDVYSFGCVVLQILSGEEPYSQIRFATRVMFAILNGLDPFSRINVNALESHRLLLSRCLSREPADRPLMREIITMLGPVAPSAQAESDSPVAPEPMFPDLTKYITKIGDYPIARGGFGDVWKCVYNTDGTRINVAVKSLHVYVSDTDSETMRTKSKRIYRELTICAKIEHPNILPVYGYASSFGPFMAIVTPWAENGNLVTYLEHEDASLPLVKRFQILRDVSAGLQYLHSQHVVHGDLTGPNVLIHSDGTACLADFGLSLLYSDAVSTSLPSSTSTFHGNLRWLAPELVKEPDNDPLLRPSMYSDIYSFGSIMLHVLTGKIPYHYFRGKLGEVAIMRCLFTKEKPDRSRYPAFSDKYWHFIEECWSAIPGDRPSTESVMKVIEDELDSLSSSNHCGNEKMTIHNLDVVLTPA